VHGSDKAYAKMKNAREVYDEAQKTYDKSYKAYDNQVDELKKDIAGYQAQIEQNKTNKTGYAKYIETLNNYISAMNSMPNIYSTLTSSSSTYASRYASRRAAYITLSTVAGKNAPEFGLYEVYQKNSFMNKDQYDNIAEKQAKIKENFQSIKKWLNNDEIHKRNANDEADPTK
jgi:chromosome segregation ATPase